MRMTTSPTGLAAVFAASVLAGCGGNVDFSIQRDFNVDATVTASTVTKDYDLAAEAGGAWKQRKHIDKITIRGASATITDPNWLGNNTASAISGSVRLQELGDPANFVEVGTFTDEPIEPGNLIPLAPSSALDDFLTSQLKGDGKFTVVATGVRAGSGDRVSVTLHVVIDATLKWKPF